MDPFFIDPFFMVEQPFFMGPPFIDDFFMVFVLVVKKFLYKYTTSKNLIVSSVQRISHPKYEKHPQLR